MDPALVLHFDYCTIQDSPQNQYYPPHFQDMSVSELKLHAPVPVPCTAPQLLQPDFYEYADYTAHHNDSFQPPNVNEYDSGYLDTICQAQESSVKMESCSVESLQSTFLTPSELLAEMAAKDLPVTGDEFGSDVRSESASKARRRTMAKKVGFIPTDPDTISSHEKKRYYLECLEQYILYLHNEFGNLGLSTGPLEKVQSYPGLTSNSMRILLVHMQNEAKQLNEVTMAEEQKFIRLRDEVQRRGEMNGR